MYLCLRTYGRFVRFVFSFPSNSISTLGRSRKIVPPTVLDFYVSAFRNDFFFRWKAFDLLNKMRYILWVVALLEDCDITKYGRHLGFYPELLLKSGKTRENSYFSCFTYKITLNKYFASFYPQPLLLSLKKN